MTWERAGQVLWARKLKIVGGSLGAGVLAIGLSFLIAPTFTARTSLLLPQQTSSASAALASLGALSSLAGAAAGIRTPGDQYVSLLQSSSIGMRLVEKFDLQSLYDVQFKTDALKRLSLASRMSAGKKDGVLTIEVDDHDPKRAADMANAYVSELRELMGRLAITEAQQRRVFFESQVKSAREKLLAAQTALQTSGYNPGSLRAEPKATAESFARLQAELTAAEVRAQALRQRFADDAPELQSALSTIAALRAQVARAETPATAPDSSYLSAYREFKYQETVFELFSRQYEAARLDEAKEGALLQVIDKAEPPERKSAPKRAYIGIGTTVAAGLVLCIAALWRNRRPGSRMAQAPGNPAA